VVLIMRNSNNVFIAGLLSQVATLPILFVFQADSE